MASLTVGGGIAAAGGGGTNAPDPPKLSDVTCIATCAGTHRATEGSRVRATGRHLDNVHSILFRAVGGGKVEGDLLRVRPRSLKAKVPKGAADGRPKVVDRADNSATSPRRLVIVSPDKIPDDGGFRLKNATARPRKAFFYGSHPAKVRYTFSGSQPMDVRVEVISRKDGKVADTFVDRDAQPNVENTARWKGGVHDRNGDYRFKVGPTSGKLGSDASAKFSYYKWKFPVRGHHTYGDGYGAPRAGHVHQGQDVMARCGTPIVAARGGRVQFRAYQAGGAGNYVVIDGKRDNHDYMYAHLKRRAKVHEGEHVHTGEKIGVVGDTGDATACHLHMEYWRGDWWGGGRPLRAVTRVLKRWDRWS